MPSIIPSPGSPGSPNVFATIPLNQNISLGVGQRLYTTSPMFVLFDHTVTLGTEYFTLNNAGTMWIDSTGIARLLFPWNFDAVTNSGLMVARSNGGDASYVFNVGSTWQSGLNNSGRMFAISTAGDAATIVDYSPGAVITNSGIIAAQGALDVGAITRMNGGQIINTATGQILAEGGDAYAIMQIYGHSGPVAPGYYDIDNAGRIEAVSTNPANASVGIYVANLDFATIRNSGTITADVAIYDLAEGDGRNQILNTATGHINGDIYLGFLDDLIDNAGSIVGDIFFLRGNDTVINTGQIIGLVSMGWGEDAYSGGANVDAVIGDRGNDVLNGGGGNDLLLGGRGSDTIAGGAGNDGLYGEFGDDHIESLGGDRISAGLGNDIVVLGDLTFADADGGAGHDTLVLPNVADILDLQAAIASGRLHSFETVALPGAQQLVIRAADVAALTGGQELRVTTNASSHVDLVGAWVAGSVVTIDGVDYTSYTQGATTVLVAGLGVVAIVASAPGGAGGLDAIAGGGAAPLPGSTPGALLTVSVTQMGAEMEAPDLIETDEIWTSNVGGGTGGWELVNYGQIISTGTSATNGARPMGYMLVNHGSISATVSGDSAELAQNINAFNTYGIHNIRNSMESNSIALGFANENWGVVTASSEASVAIAAQNVLANYGTLDATSSLFIAMGVSQSGLLNNFGDIIVNGQIAAFGVASNDFHNSGNLIVNAHGAGAESIGVYLYHLSGESIVVNSGLIDADIAIRTRQTVNGGRLNLTNSGEIHGRIELQFQGGQPREDVIRNTGLIDGQIRLGGATDVYDGAGGTQTGGVLGEAGADLLIGGAGMETLDGGADADVLNGGGGADNLTGGAGGDVFVYRAWDESAGAAIDSITDFQTGVDRIELSALAPTSVTLEFNAGITTLTAVTTGGTLVIYVTGAMVGGDVFTVVQATINGTGGADTLVATGTGSTLLGGDGDDLLAGSAANDVLNGGAGLDTMVGGAGDDTYYVEYAEDWVREFAAGGIDTIVLNPFYAAAYYMPDHVENLILASGWDGVGNALDNIITGNANNNRLNGGVGADTLIGGAGGDVYDVDNALDVVVENAGEGIDVVYASASFTLSANVENLTLVDGVGAISGTGNDLANLINGNQSANIIDGDAGDDIVYAWNGDDTVSGGAGADYIIGHEGADTIHGGADNDQAWGESGNDIVHGDAGADQLSGAARSVYDMIAQRWRPSVADDGSADQLFGGDGNDQLAGGFGADLLDGGDGADTATYLYDDVNEGVTVRLLDPANNQGLAAIGDVFVSIENLVGTTFADILGGDNGANALSGDAGADQLFGEAGDDLLEGGAGADALNGGDGLDTIAYSSSSAPVTVSLSTSAAAGGDAAGDTFTSVENITGSAFNDTLVGNDGANSLVGGAGADTLIGGGGIDSLSGGDGDDTLAGGFGVDTVSGGNGADTFIYAIGDGNGSMNGGDGLDTLSVTDGAADSILNASWNGSALTVISGNALTSIETITANLGGGIDWLFYAAASSAVTVNLATGAASGFTSVSNIERVVGGNANDELTGDNLANRLDGSAGDDTLAGGGGIDTLIGGDGADVLSGGLSNDSIQAGAGDDAISWSVGDGRDTIDGGADFDTFSATGSGSANLGNANWNGSALTALMDNGLFNIETVNLNLGGGVDWLIYNATAAVVVNLATNSASGFASVANIEKVIGGSGNDALTGDGLDNRLDGLAGADTLDGGAGSDAVLGGDGADVIYASAGNDSLQGQNGDDTFNWISTDGRDTFNGGADTDTVNLTGAAVADVADANWNGSVITGLMNNALVSIEAVNLDLGAGGAGGDWLRYNTTFGISVDLGAGTATGFASIAGVENLIGGTGGDSLTGDGGANKINGNAGDDVISGGGGADNLTGGLGNDTFVYAAGAGNDTIIDFDAWDVGGQDFLDVSAFGINAGNFAARVAIIDTGADTVIRIDDTYFITLKNVSGDGDNVITDADLIFGP
jgi:Ca2+-binding RTX toxin-like protein